MGTHLVLLNGLGTNAPVLTSALFLLLQQVANSSPLLAVLLSSSYVVEHNS
jgi:hypothetical protein